MGKSLNLRTKDGYSWEDVYAIDATGLTNLSRTNFFVEMKTGFGHDHAEATYTGSGAITIAELNAFEAGSRVFCSGLTTPALYLKTDATTGWKYQAINT